MYGCLVGQNNPSPVHTLGKYCILILYTYRTPHTMAVMQTNDQRYLVLRIRIHRSMHALLCNYLVMPCVRACEAKVASFFSFPCFFSLLA